MKRAGGWLVVASIIYWLAWLLLVDPAFEPLEVKYGFDRAAANGLPHLGRGWVTIGEASLGRMDRGGVVVREAEVGQPAEVTIPSTAPRRMYLKVKLFFQQAGQRVELLMDRKVIGTLTSAHARAATKFYLEVPPEAIPSGEVVLTFRNISGPPPVQLEEVRIRNHVAGLPPIYVLSNREPRRQRTPIAAGVVAVAIAGMAWVSWSSGRWLHQRLFSLTRSAAGWLSLATFAPTTIVCLVGLGASLASPYRVVCQPSTFASAAIGWTLVGQLLLVLSGLLRNAVPWTAHALVVWAPVIADELRQVHGIARLRYVVRLFLRRVAAGVRWVGRHCTVPGGLHWFRWSLVAAGLALVIGARGLAEVFADIAVAWLIAAVIAAWRTAAPWDS